MSNSLGTGKPEDDGEFLFEEEDVAEDAPTLDPDRFGIVGTCPTDLTYSALGHNFVVPISEWCAFFQVAGALILIIAYSVCRPYGLWIHSRLMPAGAIYIGLAWFFGTFAVKLVYRILFALGIGFATKTGVDYLVAELETHIINSVGGPPC